MKIFLSLLLLFLVPAALTAQTKRNWRTATPAELEAVLPDRAQVEKERIETEMRSATGVTDGHGKVVAAIVLITAGYSANGKYSHYLVVQSPIKVDDLYLRAGNYAIGWTRGPDGLAVHFYLAESGLEKGVATARLPEKPVPVTSLKIWPPAERSIIQIGRFVLPYSLED